MNREPDHWKRLLDAARDAGGTSTGDEEPLDPPQGFVTRLAALGAGIRREQTLALWRRWSMRAAIGSTCLFVVAAVYAVATRDAGQVLPLPSFEFPNSSP